MYSELQSLVCTALTNYSSLLLDVLHMTHTKSLAEHSPCYQGTDFCLAFYFPLCITILNKCSHAVQKFSKLKGFHKIKLQSQGRELTIKVL